MTTTKEIPEFYNDIFALRDIAIAQQERGEDGGPVNAKLLGRILTKAAVVVESGGDANAEAFVETLELYAASEMFAGKNIVILPTKIIDRLIDVTMTDSTLPEELLAIHPIEIEQPEILIK